jgi:hypothetical protein
VVGYAALAFRSDSEKTSNQASMNSILKSIGLTALLVAAALMTGCNTSYDVGKMMQGLHNKNSALYVGMPVAGKAKVVFVRPPDAAKNCKYNIRDCDHLIGLLEPKSYCVYECTPGYHLFNCANEEDSITVLDANLLPDRIYYVKIVSLGATGPSRMYSLYPESAGNEWIRLLKLLPALARSSVTAAEVEPDRQKSGGYQERIKKFRDEHYLANPQRDQILPEHGQRRAVDPLASFYKMETPHIRQVYLHEYSPTVWKADRSRRSLLRGVTVSVKGFAEAFDCSTIVPDQNGLEPQGWLFSNIATNTSENTRWNKDAETRNKSIKLDDCKPIGYVRDVSGRARFGVFSTVPPGDWLSDTLKMDLENQGAQIVGGENATVSIQGTIRYLTIDACGRYCADLVADVEITVKDHPPIKQTFHTIATEHRHVFSTSAFECFKSLRQCQQKFSAAMIDGLESVLSQQKGSGK